MSTSAIIVIDLQNEYWPGGNVPLEGVGAAAANAARVLEKARASGGFIVHVQHLSADPSVPIFQPGSHGAEINAAVRPAGDELLVQKYYPNAFRDTGLKQILDDKAVKNVVIVGAMSHMCIAATARAAADFGYGVTVLHDACATREVDFDGVTVPAAHVHAANMSALAYAYGAVIPTDAYLSP
ncbi:cysteine hydrolase family protein [Sphingopyxis sp. R3-92]|uniref:cysteine hydrolase family protein n=1 Tax=Sphingopyxis sp. R3-92 TaxID=3158553 RepID=UPI003EE48498